MVDHPIFASNNSGNPSLTSWVLIPQRPSVYPDPVLRAYSSAWPKSTRAFAAADHSYIFYDEYVVGQPT